MSLVAMQAYVGRARAESFSLTADMMYVSQNAPRICRALFEICLRRSWSTAADMALTMCKVCDSWHVCGLSPYLGTWYPMAEEDMQWICAGYSIDTWRTGLASLYDMASLKLLR